VELKGERSLQVDRATAWGCTQRRQRTEAAVPGCESIARIDDSHLDVAVNAAIGPVKSRFEASSNWRTSCRPSRTRSASTCRADGWFLARRAHVKLDAVDAATTRMSYVVNASIGGKIAQVGSRLVDAAAATMADRFFATFAADLAAKHPPAAGAPAVAVPRAPGFFATLWSFLKRLFGGK
jgi:carbon monoxide dehydrogenase subunit G